MEKYFAAALTSVDQIGVKRASLLIKHFGSAQAAWTAPEDELLEVGLPEKVVQSLLSLRQKFPNMAEEIMERCAAKEIGVCGIDDDDYPEELRSIDDAPLILYYKGKIQPTAKRISIVGTREITHYGQKATLEIAEDLARAGITIVSGGAIGIDTYAHRGALNGGRTIAVLGCGIEAYPSYNAKLFDRIMEEGALISEYPPRMPPMPGQFPRRNRIIAGLSKAVIVVEAGNKSGALYTANFAIEYKRLLFAVPGSIYAERSQGCNELIKKGAILARSAADVFNACDIDAPSEKLTRAPSSEPLIEKKIVESKPRASKTKKLRAEPQLEDDEALVYSLTVDPPTDLDGLLMRADDASERMLTPQELSNILLTLELKGLVMTDEHGCYSRR